MSHYIAVTDSKWFNYLLANNFTTNVNFWRNDTRTSKLVQGSYFYFKIKGRKYIAGRGKFKKFLVLDKLDAISQMKSGNNGFNVLNETDENISKRINKMFKERTELGCIVLDELEFLKEENYYKVNDSLFNRHIQQGKIVEEEEEIIDLINLFKKESSNSIQNRIAIIENTFNPSNLKDQRDYALTTLVKRRGQREFRNTLINAYDGQCAVTNTKFIEVLEAAHILPYSGKKSNHPSNGLLLRADIHTLFNLHLIEINEKYEIIVSNKLATTEYWKYKNKHISQPKQEGARPNKEALKLRAKKVY